MSGLGSEVLTPGILSVCRIFFVKFGVKIRGGCLYSSVSVKSAVMDDAHGNMKGWCHSKVLKDLQSTSY